MGGLIKDVKSKEILGIPFLSKVPILGEFFKREIYDTQKVDLLIFITARVLKEGEFTEAEIAKLEQRFSKPAELNITQKAVVPAKKKKK